MATRGEEGVWGPE